MLRPLKCLFSVFIVTACVAVEPPEERLQRFVIQELEWVERFQGDYVGYMEYQVKRFSDKQEEMATVIAQINEKFVDLPSIERPVYEEKWRQIFAPLMQELVKKTSVMVSQQKKDILPHERAKIQELSIKISLLEKQTFMATLIPRFY